MEDIPIRWKCPTCQRSHSDLVPGNAKDLLNLKLRCPGCSCETALSESLREVGPHRTSRRPAER